MTPDRRSPLRQRSIEPEVALSGQAGSLPQEPPTLTIHSGTIADAALITRLISEPAELDNALQEEIRTEAGILCDRFGADPHFRALIAEWFFDPPVLDATRRGAEQLFTGRISLFAADVTGAALGPRCSPESRLRPMEKSESSFDRPCRVGISQRSAWMTLLMVTSLSKRRRPILLTIVFSSLQNDLPHRVAGFSLPGSDPSSN
jgi:hypothetical protein